MHNVDIYKILSTVIPTLLLIIEMVTWRWCGIVEVRTLASWEVRKILRFCGTTSTIPSTDVGEEGVQKIEISPNISGRQVFLPVSGLAQRISIGLIFLVC